MVFVASDANSNAGTSNDTEVKDLLDSNDKLVEGALFHLTAIHDADKAKSADAPYDGSLVGVAYGLIDLILLRGVAPSLSPGVLFAQRPRSVLVAEVSEPSSPAPSLLPKVITKLVSISDDNGLGIQPLVSQRALPDIISGLAELAFSPNTITPKQSFEIQYKRLLETTATSRLLPILTSFLQQALPPWLRQRLSGELARAPLRNRGVRHTIDFVSLSYLAKNSQAPQPDSGSLSQIPLPLEALTQVSKLLASVPTGMSPSEWFVKLAPQLLELLDGKDGHDLSRAAGQIIAGGILNRKSTGAPGSIGWDLFARPLLHLLNPDLDQASGRNTVAVERSNTLDAVLVPEEDLFLGLKRLSVIVSSYSHPGLIKRLTSPCLLPLWGLIGYASSRKSLDPKWTRLSRIVLSRYLELCCDPKQIDLLTTNLLLDGGRTWTFGPGAEGGVEIRKRELPNSGREDVDGIFSRLEKLEDRVKLFVAFLAEAKLDDDVAGSIFLNVTKRWLLTAHEKPDAKASLLDLAESDPLNALIDAKLSEALASQFQDKLARSPQHIMELVRQLLQDFVHEHKLKAKRNQDFGKATLADLRNITEHGTSDLGKHSGGGPGSSSESDSEDLVSFGISTLNSLVDSPKFTNTAKSEALISEILPLLRYLAEDHISPPVSSVIVNAAASLVPVMQLTSGGAVPAPVEDPLDTARSNLKNAISEMSSSEPPNRAWALSSLRAIINDPATLPLVDIPSTTHLMLSAAVADSESFVYSAAIPVLVDLATLAPSPVVRILVDGFVDVDERSLRLKKENELPQALDFRLRIGEVLNNFATADNFWNGNIDAVRKHDALKRISEAILSVASRRGQRVKTLSKRNELAEAEQRAQEEGEEAWGGPIPNLLADEQEETMAKQKEREALIKIVEGWEKTGVEDDVRVRASALSILGSITEQRLDLLHQPPVDAALQMVLNTLLLERGIEKGILRRAAVLVVMGLLKGMDSMLENGKDSVTGLRLQQSEEIERIMKWIRDVDNDELVRSHAENVLEGLETWRMKKWFGFGTGQVNLGPNLGLEGNIRGLDIDPLENGNAMRKTVFVEEID